MTRDHLEWLLWQAELDDNGDEPADRAERQRRTNRLHRAMHGDDLALAEIELEHDRVVQDMARVRAEEFSHLAECRHLEWYDSMDADGAA